MKCHKVKSLITEYIDNELNKNLSQDIARHLDTCPVCRQMEQSLRGAIIQPLSQAKMQAVPERIWYQLKDAIINRKQPSYLADLIARWFSYLQIKRPVLAPLTAMLIVALLVSVFFFGRIPTSQNGLSAYLAEQTSFILQLAENGEESYLGIEEVSLGTSIEKYLL
jgi:predicted anti-sigma-YlaC factor YlaD